MVPGKQQAWRVPSAQEWLVGLLQVRGSAVQACRDTAGHSPILLSYVLICTVFLEHLVSSSQLCTY